MEAAGRSDSFSGLCIIDHELPNFLWLRRIRLGPVLLGFGSQWLPEEQWRDVGKHRPTAGYGRRTSV
jgi:hypothetical protein